MQELFFQTTNGLNENWLKLNHAEYYSELFKVVLETNISLSERIYLFQNNLVEKPKCLQCDNKVNFIKFYKGYRKFCSVLC